MHQTQLRVEADGESYPLLRRWATGFSIAVQDAPALSGVVDLYDGVDHWSQCLITGKETANDEIVFTVKRGSGVDYSAAVEFAGSTRISSSH